MDRLVLMRNLRTFYKLFLVVTLILWQKIRIFWIGMGKSANLLIFVITAPSLVH